MHCHLKQLLEWSVIDKKMFVRDITNTKKAFLASTKIGGIKSIFKMIIGSFIIAFSLKTLL